MAVNLDDKHTISLGDACLVCGASTTSVFALPSLPLTDTFVREFASDPVPNFDQAFRFCPSCHHGQLAIQVAPSVLYGGHYGFRTSASLTAKKGTDFFFSVLNEAAPDRTFEHALDLGCNDLFLLSKLEGRATARVGVDPIWAGREHEANVVGIKVIGQGIEDVVLSDLDRKPDLVVCRHTLEHIANPLDVVKRMLEGATDDALFIFEVPGIEALINRNRFDQVFHQHLQYFSQDSFARMLKLAGATPILWKNNYHDWGAFAVAFVKGSGEGAVHGVASPDLDRVIDSRNAFLSQMATVHSTLQNMDGPIYGYGAAQMLPVLAYHLKSDLSFLKGILDDDPEKDGVLYGNLPVQVRPSASIKDLSEISVLITAVDNSQPILRTLLSKTRPRHIVCPFHIL
ncbi:MAG: methyltransferase domain-containing protein [Magnetovibrio sp.]|nr:methyltransferase domain-containing protein [Magnetovibrio sp.]